MKFILTAFLFLSPLYAEDTEPKTETLLNKETKPSSQGVVLQALDKITGRVTILKMKTNEVTTFGNIKITCKYCNQNPPEETPESRAFIEISEEKEDQKNTLFSNWMFASTPSLSTLEHPIYAVWVKECWDDKKG